MIDNKNKYHIKTDICCHFLNIGVELEKSYRFSAYANDAPN